MEQKWNKGGPSFFHRYLKNVVADHQSAQERAPRGGCSPTLAYPIVRQSSCCLPFGIRCDRPYPCPVLYVTSRQLKLRLALGSGSLPAASCHTFCSCSPALSI